MNGASRRRSQLSWWAVPAVVVPAAAVLVGGDAAGRPALAVAVIALQAVLLACWWLLFTGSVDAVVLAAIGVAVGDVVLLRTRSAGPGAVAGVIGLSVIAVLFHQVVRRDRRGVVNAVALTLSAIVCAIAPALLLPLRELAYGRSVVGEGVVAAGLALLAARLLPAPDAVRRVSGLAVGGFAGLLYGLPAGGLSSVAGLGLGLAAAAAALLADRMTGRIAAPPAAGPGTPYGGALAPVVLLLPLLLASPIAYLAGRVIASHAG